MRVVRYDNFGGIDELWIDEVPPPATLPGHVLVRVISSCINPGSLSALDGAPYTPARDLAGIVIACGDEVEGFAPGDAVLGWLQEWAAHAEFVVVPVDQLIAKPADLPWAVAGSLFVTPMAGSAGVVAVSPRAGETAVVSGASGGVGFTSAQLSVHKGATVIGIASSGNHARLLEHGIIPVEYGPDQAEHIREAANGRPIDAFIDAVGSGYVELALALGVSTARINTVVDYAAAKQYGVSTLGTMNAGGLPALRELAALAASGDLSIPIAASYPLSEIKSAYRDLAARTSSGRVVLYP